MTGLALGLFLLLNHLHHLKGNALNASGVLETFWRLVHPYNAVVNLLNARDFFW